MTLADISEITGVHRDTISGRLARGLSVAQAVNARVVYGEKIRERKHV